MQSPNRKYIAELDQLRACAALLVFLYHTIHTGRASAGLVDWPTATPFSAILVEGHTGVALFMVLSGFVLASGVLGRSLDYRQFITNRTLRIFPLMVFVVVFAIYGNTNVTLSGIVSPFLLLSNTTPRLFTDVTNISGTVWTIAVEFQFYLIAPFVFAFVSRGGMRYLLGLMLLTWLCKFLVIVLHADPIERYTIGYYTIVGRLNQFLIGVGLAYIWPRLEAKIGQDRRIGWGLLIAGVVAVASLAFVINLGGGDRVWKRWMYLRQDAEALTWAAVIAGYVLVRPFGRSKAATWLTNAGVISFSIYIFHWPLEQLFWQAIQMAGWVPAVPSTPILLGYAAALLPIVLAVAWLSYAVIEKPFLDMRRRYVEDSDVKGAPLQAA